MENLISGTDIVVKFGVADAEVAVYCSTSCTLNLTADTVAASCKDGGSWNQNIEGNKSWDISVDGLYQTVTAAGFVDISDLLVTGPNDVSIIFGQDTTAGEIYWTGSAVCTSASLTGPDGEIATWSATFVGNGPLTKEIVPV